MVQIILQKYDDPAHGWVEVPIMLLKALGIEGQISNFSYTELEAGIAYLEEDCDAERLIEALNALGITVMIDTNLDEENESFIRELDHYCVESVRSYAAWVEAGGKERQPPNPQH